MTIDLNKLVPALETLSALRQCYHRGDEADEFSELLDGIDKFLFAIGFYPGADTARES